MTNGFMDSLSGALNNRDVLKMMAQVGTELDPQGVGGMLGRPTSQMIQREAQGEAMNQLLQALGGNNNLTGAKVSPDGSLSLTGKSGMDADAAQASGLSPQAAASPNQQTTPTETSGLADMGEFDSFLDNILGNLFSGEGGI
jgi:hypothetical protein